MTSLTDTSEYSKLCAAAAAFKADDSLHLRELCGEAERCSGLVAKLEGEEGRAVVFDYSRQQVVGDTMDLLFDLAEKVGLNKKMNAMYVGDKINCTEGRSVLHHALRMPKNFEFSTQPQVVNEVHGVLDRVNAFTEKVRTGAHTGATGKKLLNVVAIGIGGSQLGPEFVNEALRADTEAMKAAEGRTLRFLANVDPVDFTLSMAGLDPEETLIIVVSKTFTTAETMLNARTARSWLLKGMGGKGVEDDVVLSKQFIAVSSAVDKAKAFGIDPENVFGFWDWVGGRYSVCSAVGIVPLSLQYSFGVMEKFLAGAHNIDEHFFKAPARENIPVIMGLLGVWNSTFLKYETRCLLPYSQALKRFPAHIQQVDMESNGKRVTMDGSVLPFAAGEFNFGEPGTNGQHSFYQLLHQGRVAPADFIGFCKSQTPVEGEGERVSNHDELMANFFAQPDALAYGKTLADCEAEGIAKELQPHKVFAGNRPSSSLLMTELDAFGAGQLLALYEHRTAVQGFVWGINSFDQWGVELGKALAGQVRKQLEGSRKEGKVVAGFNSSTTLLLETLLGKK